MIESTLLSLKNDRVHFTVSLQIIVESTWPKFFRSTVFICISPDSLWAVLGFSNRSVTLWAFTKFTPGKPEWFSHTIRSLCVLQLSKSIIQYTHQWRPQIGGSQPHPMRGNGSKSKSYDEWYWPLIEPSYQVYYDRSMGWFQSWDFGLIP